MPPPGKLPQAITSWAAGSHHAKFGEGTVLNIEGQGEHARIQVNFQDAGNKWLVISFAKLELVA